MSILDFSILDLKKTIHFHPGTNRSSLFKYLWDIWGYNIYQTGLKTAGGGRDHVLK